MVLLVSITICFPTRGRPDNVKRLVESVLTTTANPTQIVVYMDEDDDSLPIVGTLDAVSVIVGPRKTLSSCYNDCAEVAKGDILMFAGDDVVFRTKDWDVKVEEAFAVYEDRILFVHGDDGYWGDNLGTHGFLHRNWINAVGYFTPPYFACDFTDLWITDVANVLHRRTFLRDVLFEHMHPAFNKAEWDKTHNERLARSDGGKMYQQTARERLGDVEKLRRVMPHA